MGIGGIIGGIGDASGTPYGRYETKRLWQFQTFWYPMVATSELNTFFTEDVKNSLTIACRNVSRPTITTSIVEIKHGNENYNLAGKTKWSAEDITLIFDDVIPQNAIANAAGESTSQYSASNLFYQWQSLIQNPVTGIQNVSNDYKCILKVLQNAPDSTVVEGFLMYGGFPTSVAGENWDYDNEDSGNKVTVTFRFDKIFRLTTDMKGTNTLPTVDYDYSTETVE